METTTDFDVEQMGKVRALIKERAGADEFTFLDWQRNRGDTGWTCTIYVADERTEYDRNDD
jgi:hypothetical protein